MEQPRPAETAILAATERLLQERPFAELSVNDILAAAGVSRTTFYAHFGSRGAALAACLRRVVGDLTVAVDPFIGAAQDDPEAAIRDSLRRWVALAREHGPLLRTVSEEWPHDEELRELWFAVMAGFSAGTATAIERARAAGTAPPGADALALATCLMWGYERVLHVSLVGDAVGLPDPEAIVEPLAQMMVAGVFGRAL
jgi:TetR/AcrR family transcriptional regulator, ethionamide resistance regulator